MTRPDGPRVGVPLRPAPDNEQEFTPHPIWMRWLLAGCWIAGLLLTAIAIWMMMQGKG